MKAVNFKVRTTKHNKKDHFASAPLSGPGEIDLRPMNELDVGRLKARREEISSSGAAAGLGIFGVLLCLLFVGIGGASLAGSILGLFFGGLLVALAVALGRSQSKTIAALTEDLDGGIKEILAGPVQEKKESHGKSSASYSIQVLDRWVPVDISAYANLRVGDRTELHLAPRSGELIAIIGPDGRAL